MSASGLGAIRVYGSGALVLPAVTLTGIAVSKHQGSGALVLPSLSVSGVGIIKTVGTGTLVLPTVTLTGTGLSKKTGTGALTLPSIEVSGTGIAIEFITGTGALTLPKITVRGRMVATPVCPFADVSHMPNDFFHFHDNSSYDNDRMLYKDLNMEGLNIYGTPLTYYVVSYDTTYDPLFGEDDDRRIARKFPIKAQFQIPPELELYAGQGIEGLDNFTMFVSKKHFEHFSQYDNDSTMFPVAWPEDTSAYSAYTPKAGDILKSEYNNLFYEVLDIGEEEEMFLQKKHTWIFTVRPFRDEHLSLSASTSATMTEISAHLGADDIMDHNDYITSAEEDVLYDPSATETSSSQDDLDGW